MKSPDLTIAGFFSRENRFNSLMTKDDHKRFEDALKEFKGSHFWFPAFGVSSYLQNIRRATEIANNSKLVEPIFGHPGHFVSVTKVWRTWKVTRKWPTSGER